MLKREIAELKNELKESKKEEIRNRQYSIDDAIEYIDDYYDFYRADHKYRNPRARKSSNNVFIISLEEQWTRYENWWTPKVLTLTINQNGTYSVTFQ